MTRWLPICLLVFAFLLIGCTGGNTPKADQPKKSDLVAQNGGEEKKSGPDGDNENKEKKGDEKPKDDKGDKKFVELKPDFILTADEMTAEFRKDDKAAKAKFDNKMVQLSGQAGSIYADTLGVLGPEIAGRFRRDNVNCIFLPSQAQQAYQLATDQKIKVLGKGRVEYGAFNLTSCTITELEPNKIGSVTAESLAKNAEKLGPQEFKSSPEYSSRRWIVSGAVVDVARSKRVGYEMYDVFLKGTEKTRLRLEVVGPNDKNLPKKGDSVKVAAEPGEYATEKNEVEIHGFLISPK